MKVELDKVLAEIDYYAFIVLSQIKEDINRSQLWDGRLHRSITNYNTLVCLRQKMATKKFKRAKWKGPKALKRIGVFVEGKVELNYFY